jgi:hypothetical protein
MLTTPITIVRGGRIFLTVRPGPEKVMNMGDRLDLLIPLNRDPMDRHLALHTDGAARIYNSDTIKPGVGAEACSCARFPSPCWLTSRGIRGS